MPREPLLSPGLKHQVIMAPVSRDDEKLNIRNDPPDQNVLFDEF